mmetsp:Transcript_4090/g.8273  ORF Transcript_4090/g.8273 Transcript_4090/m.8273 type:complete len:288 (-) Transcript_4090:27-890(-)
MRSSSWLDILGYVLLFPVFVLDVVSHVVMSFFGSSNINKTNKNKKKTYSQYSTARGNATATRGEPRSSSSSSGTLMSIFRVDGDDHESKTIYEMTQRAVALHGDNRIAMRSRKFVELRKKHENDRFPSKVYDDENGFDDVTYRDLGRVTEQFGKGLRALGLQKKTTGGDDDNNNNNDHDNDHHRPARRLTKEHRRQICEAAGVPDSQITQANREAYLTRLARLRSSREDEEVELQKANQVELEAEAKQQQRQQRGSCRHPTHQSSSAVATKKKSGRIFSVLRSTFTR